MAYDALIRPFSLPASADLSGKQFCFMAVNSSAQLAAAGDGAVAYGVLQDKPDTAGTAGMIALPGSVTKIVVGTAIAAGDEVACDANGAAEPAETADDVILGVCLVGAAAGGIGTIVFNPGRVVPTA